MATTTHAAVERIQPPPRWVIDHLVNPVARRMLRHKGKLGEEILLLRFEGRKTGKHYEVPISYQRIDGRIALFTTHKWRYNFQGGRDAEVVLRGETLPVRATLMSEPTLVASIFAERLEEVGTKEASRRLGIKIYVDREPTLTELEDMVRDSKLSIVWLDLASPPR